MKTILTTALPVFVCLFWTIQTAIELFQRRERPLIKLLAFMTTSTLLYLGHFFYFNHITTVLPLSDSLYCLANLAVYPLFLLYLRSLTHRPSFEGRYRLLLLPSVIGGLLVAGLYLSMNDTETALFIEHYLYGDAPRSLTGLPYVQSIIHESCHFVFVLQVIPVFLIGRRYIRRFNEEVASSYADTEGKTLHAMHVLLILFVVTSMFSLACALLGRSLFAEIPWLLSIPSLAFSALLFAIGYLGCHQQFSIEDIARDEEESTSMLASESYVQEQPSEGDHETSPALRRRIEQVMREEQLFLKPNFKLNDLVLRVGSNRNYVYNSINREMGVSFNEYVNRMRVDYAVALIDSDTELSLTEVGERSGFASATSFYRNFRLYKGCSPKEYRSDLRLSKATQENAK